MIDAIEQIRDHINSTLDSAAADALVARIPAPELCTALATLLRTDDAEAISDACLVIRDCALLASRPRRDAFATHLRASGVIAQLEGLVFDDDHFTQSRAIYTLGKIVSTESLPVLKTAFMTYRDTDPLLMLDLMSECIWLGADEWDLLDQMIASLVYPTRWCLIHRLDGVEGAARNARAYVPRRLRYLEALQHDAQPLIRAEATYWRHVLTTALPRHLSSTERARRRAALDALTPPVTLLTWSMRFGNHLHQLGQRSYTVRELEEFIDRLVSTLGLP